MRCFVAVNLDRPIREEITKLQQDLGQKVKGFRWTKAELLHITLKFLGEIDLTVISSFADKLEDVARRTRAFNLSFAGLGVFPGVSKPRVIWVGLEQGAVELARLAEDVALALEEKGGSSFIPHLTIGRAKKNEKQYFPRDLIGNSWTGIDTSQVAGFSLMESFLFPSGPVYKELKNFFFKAC